MWLVLGKFWPHILAGVLLAALLALGAFARTLDRENSALSSQLDREQECADASYCKQAVTEYERDTAQAATKSLTQAADKIGVAAKKLDDRRAEIEAESLAERSRHRAKLREMQAQLEEAMNHDPQCKAWLDAPVPCPVPDPGGVLFKTTERVGLIDRGGERADPEVRAAPEASDSAAVPRPDGQPDDGRPEAPP